MNPHLQIKAIEHSMNQGGTPEGIPLAEDLLAVDGCWGRQTHFSLGVSPLVIHFSLGNTIPLHLWVTLARISTLNKKISSSVGQVDSQ